MVSDKNKKANKARREQENQGDSEKMPASDIYGNIKDKDPETCVEIPTEEAVEEAKEWVDNENRR